MSTDIRPLRRSGGSRRVGGGGQNKGHACGDRLCQSNTVCLAPRFEPPFVAQPPRHQTRPPGPWMADSACLCRTMPVAPMLVEIGVRRGNLALRPPISTRICTTGTTRREAESAGRGSRLGGLAFRRCRRRVGFDWSRPGKPAPLAHHESNSRVDPHSDALGGHPSRSEAPATASQECQVSSATCDTSVRVGGNAPATPKPRCGVQGATFEHHRLDFGAKHRQAPRSAANWRQSAAIGQPSVRQPRPGLPGILQ